MAVYEKRGYIKEYDENGKIISKVRKQAEEAPVPAPTPEVIDAYYDGDE